MDIHSFLHTQCILTGWTIDRRQHRDEDVCMLSSTARVMQTLLHGPPVGFP